MFDLGVGGVVAGGVWMLDVPEYTGANRQPVHEEPHDTIDLRSTTYLSHTYARVLPDSVVMGWWEKMSPT